MMQQRNSIQTLFLLILLFCLHWFSKEQQFVDVFGQIYNRSRYQSTWFLRHCSVCLCPLRFAIQHLDFSYLCSLPLSCHGCCTVSHNPLSSLDPSDCGCPGGQGPSADYHEAADWIVFLIPGGWPLQEHPNTGVWLSSTGQRSVTYESNYCCTSTPTASKGLFSCPKHDKPPRVITAWIRLYRNFSPPSQFLTWRSVNWEHRCDFILTDNEVLRAEDPNTKRVLRGLWRAACLSKWIHVEGNEEDE